jgi:AraC-like DNA-binding protein
VEASESRAVNTSLNRLAAWTASTGDHLSDNKLFAADLITSNAHFQTCRLGALRFAQVTSRGNAVDRLVPGETNGGTPACMLVVQIEGQGLLSQYGHQAGLTPGDLALADCGARFRHRIDADSSLLLVRMPAKALRAHLPSPEQFCGRRLAATGSMASLAAALARSLFAQAQSGLPAIAHDCLARQLLETVALAYTQDFGQLISTSSVVGGRYARARLFVEQNLGDPELGPLSVASALNVSARYLRMIFASEGECISAYVLRRRLEETARQLADPRWRGRSICEIAFSWGFNSAPHFSRSFREHFGMSPREYRARQTTADGNLQPDSLAATA